MPSAATNQSNKLEKQSSVSSMQNSGGGGTEFSAGEKSVHEGSDNCNIGSTNAKEKNAASGGGASVGATGSTTTNDALNPMKQTLITIEHKIRNLEKRKTKLESYRAIQASGKELSADQKAAVAKYDVVMSTLDFARDLSKQLVQYSKDAEKEQKKQARKDAILRAHAETAKIREVLTIQNVLLCLTDEAVRVDFVNGENGAAKLEPEDLIAFEKLYADIQTRRSESDNDLPFVTTAQKAAEHLSMTVDARPKQYYGTTYENMRRSFLRIQECGYLDKVYRNGGKGDSATEEETSGTSGGECGEETITAEEYSMEEGMDNLNISISNAENEDEEVTVLLAADNDNVQQTLPYGGSDVLVPNTQLQSIEPQPQQEQQIAQPDQKQKEQQATSLMAQSHQKASGAAAFQPQAGQNVSSTAQHVSLYASQQHLPSGNMYNVSAQPHVGGSLPQQQSQVGASSGASAGQQMASIHGAPQPAGSYQGTTVHAVEQNYFNQHHQQYLLQMRPLAEVIGGGSFFFLQDSELDTPEGGNPALPSGGLIFEQQSQSNLIAHSDDLQQKTQDMPLQAQQLQQVTISTQTFTNQSFPPLHQQQTQQATLSPGAGATLSPPAGNMDSCNTPSPLYQQKQQLFSPVAAQHQELNTNLAANQLLLGGDQQPSQEVLIMPCAPSQNARMQQQQPSTIGMQTSDLKMKNNNVGMFSFGTNPIASYEQQMQQQQLVAATLKSGGIDVNETVSGALDQNNVEESLQYGAAAGEPFNEWEVSLKANAIKVNNGVLEATNSWAAELNNSNSGGGNGSQMRKNEWANSSGSGGYGGDSNNSGNTDTSNHWNSNQSQDIGGSYVRGGGGTRGPNSYHQRRGDERRGERDDRRRDDRSGGGYRGRPNNYSQQNGNRGGNAAAGGGMYFRGTDNSGGSGSSNYYQNGNNAYGNKDSGARYDGGVGNYRGQRGGSNGGNGGGNNRGNPMPPRSMGGRSGDGRGANSSTYMNPRQSNRLPMGIDKN